jgi:hypothetical protein
MRKVYKINGKTEVHLVLESPSGKTKYKIAFTKGNLDPKMLAPATYSTSDPVMQEVIERDKLFNKVIFIDKVYGEIAPAAAPAAPAAPSAPAKSKGKGKAADKGEALVEMPEVTTLADAVTVLTAEGASAADFDGSVKGAIKIAKGLGLSFPNLKGE